MTDFCSLHIRSDVHAKLPEGFLKSRRKFQIVFEDNESPERLACFDRLARKGVHKRVGLPRYQWTFSSEGFVNGFDVYEHLRWVLDQVHADFLLSQLQNLGFQCLLQFYWEGNGTGGGPLVTPQIAELLVQHSVGLQFGFYLEVEKD
ncbi:hypothetical protein [Caenimonas aquaedulcis]|uniref:DUF4279 domain-containing protein n=1 Tax=Caenimonas aquaedulcis TaxID=2793270 RepID=A0A931H147_9BURK|nr:hypothetical protein [Caenimonas aquaedulcis]MBG9386649.1 hypothetical protein [Caenimonas aquaedulcis]